MKKKTFVDSNVLIRALYGDAEVSEPALQVLGDPDREFLSSDIVELESTTKCQYEKNQVAIDFYASFFSVVVGFDRTTPAAVQDALSLGRQYGIAGMDALLAAAALRLGADEFVTAEKPTKPFFRLQGQFSMSLTSLHVPAT